MELGLCQIFVEVNKFILGKPLPNYEYTKYALPALIKVMINENDSEILTDSLWALSYLTDGDEERI
jgi:importin subunit alpha-1